jgi:hypothetical protein
VISVHKTFRELQETFQLEKSVPDFDPQADVNDTSGTVKPPYSVQIRYTFIYGLTYLNHSECHSTHSHQFLYPYLIVRKPIKL